MRAYGERHGRVDERVDEHLRGDRDERDDRRGLGWRDWINASILEQGDDLAHQGLYYLLNVELMLSQRGMSCQEVDQLVELICRL